MTSRLRILSERFQNLEDRVWRSSQRPPIERMVSSGDTIRIIGFTNPFTFQILCKRADLVEAVDHWYSDGALLCRSVGWGRGKAALRYSFDFSSIADEVFDYAQRSGTTVALLGGNELEISTASSYLRGRYPKLVLTWTRSGYFQDSTRPDGGRAEAIDALAVSGAGIIIIGMGTPLQEAAAIDLKKRMKSLGKAGVIFTCGGFLTQTAQGGDYYPELVKRTGTRWLYRAVLERHVRRRLLRDYPRFIVQMTACRLYRLRPLRSR